MLATIFRLLFLRHWFHASSFILWWYWINLVLNRLLNTLTHALESSGVDLSQTSISVQLDIGKRTNSGMTSMPFGTKVCISLFFMFKLKWLFFPTFSIFGVFLARCYLPLLYYQLLIVFVVYFKLIICCITSGRGWAH